MKFNFRKIASVFASVVMLGSTVGIAAAANYPAPFVAGGAADVAIVYGTGAGISFTDGLAASEIQSSLQYELGSQTASGGTTSAGTVSGEAKAIETSGQKLYLGDYMNTTKEAFTKSELPTVLADGKITDADGTTFDYNQKIIVPNTRVKYDKTNDNLATPVLYVDFPDSTAVYQTQVIFPTAVNTTKLANKDITLFGRKYTFTGNVADLTTTKVVLFENTQGKTISSGASETVTIDGKDYAVAVTSVEDGTHGTISVDGVSESVTEGGSYKISGLDFYVKNVIGPSVAGETRAIELYVGSAKLILSNGDSVTKGTTNVYGTSVAFTSGGTGKISKIAITITPSALNTRVRYVKMGDSLTDPIFGTIKMDFVSYVPELEAASKNKIVIKPTGEQKGKIAFTNYVGGEYDLEIFMPADYCVNSVGVANGTFCCDTTYAYNATKLGYDSTYAVVTTIATAIREDDYFITNNNQYSQIFRVDRIDVNNKKVRLRDQATGSVAQEISLSDSIVGSTSTLTLADGSSATLNLTGNATTRATLNVTISKASPILYTKSGAKIDLTLLTDRAYNQTSSKTVVTEETSYNDGDFKNNAAATLGNTINVTMLYNRAGKTGYDMFLNSPTVGGALDSGTTVGDYDKYFLTSYGSFVKQTGNDDKTVEVFHSGTAASLGVFIGEIGAAVTPGTSGTGGSVANLGYPVYRDTEITSVSTKNLIVVGGSCINTVAAKILGSETAKCGADFTTLAGVGANQALIKVVTSPYSVTKVAMLIAGYEAADTTKAAKYVTTEKPATTKDTTTKLSTSSAVATIVTAAA